MSTTNNAKNFLKFHIILVCKYRKELLIGSLGKEIKRLVKESAQDFSVDIQEIDRDHIHVLVSSIPRLSPSMIVRRIKQYTTYHIWRDIRYTKFLKKHFWKEKTFWTDGYFVSSIGYASEDTVRKYIGITGMRNSCQRLKIVDFSSSVSYKSNISIIQ